MFQIGKTIVSEDILEKKDWVNILSTIRELTKKANSTGLHKLKYLAKEHILHRNVNSNNFFLFRAKIVDYGSALAFRDQDWQLPKGRSQRFIEETFKFKQEDY